MYFISAEVYERGMSETRIPNYVIRSMSETYSTNVICFRVDTHAISSVLMTVHLTVFEEQ